MKKETKIVLSIMALLMAGVTVLAFLNRDRIAQMRERSVSGTFVIVADKERHEVSMDTILALEPQIIDANLKKNALAPVPRKYTGVSLLSLFEYFHVDFTQAENVLFSAPDGFSSFIGIEQAADPENCFIVYKADGELIGTRENGGDGPFMMILAKDPFSNRWCKYLMEVELQ